MSTLFEIARNAFAVVGILVVAALGGCVGHAAWHDLKEARTLRALRRREADAAVERFRTDMTAYELLSSASDPSGGDDDRS